MTGCKVVMRFICVYIIADEIQGNKGFHVGYTDVSCNHCLDKFLASFGGEVIYQKRYRFLPPWDHIKKKLEQIGLDWIAEHCFDEK